MRTPLLSSLALAVLVAPPVLGQGRQQFADLGTCETERGEAIRDYA